MDVEKAAFPPDYRPLQRNVPDCVSSERTRARDDGRGRGLQAVIDRCSEVSSPSCEAMRTCEEGGGHTPSASAPDSLLLISI